MEFSPGMGGVRVFPRTADLERERARADQEKLRADRLQEEMTRRQRQHERENQTFGANLAKKFLENVEIRKNLIEWEKAVKADRAEIDEVLANANRQLADVRVKRARLQAEINELHLDQEEVEADRAKLDRDFAKLDEQGALWEVKAKQELKAMEDKEDKFIERVKAFQVERATERASIQADREALRREHDERAARLSELEKKHDERAARLSEQEKAQEATRVQLAQEAARLAKAQEARAQLAEEQARFEKAQETTRVQFVEEEARLEKARRTHEEQAAHLARERSTFKENASQLDQKMSAAEATKLHYERSSLELAAERKKLEEEVSELAVKREAQDKRHKDLVAEKTSVETQKEQVVRDKATAHAMSKKAVVDARQEIEELSQENAKLTQEKESIKVTLECRRAELAKLNQEYNSLQPQVLDCYVRHKDLGLQCDALEHLKAERTADVHKLTEDRSVLKDAVARAQAQLDQKKVVQEQVEKKTAMEETDLLAKVNPRVVLDVFMSNRLEHEFTMEEERSFQDAAEVPDGSVFKDKLEALEAATGKRREDAENDATEHAMLDADAASSAIVGALLSLQAIQKADRTGSKELLAELNERFSWQVVRVANTFGHQLRGSSKKVIKETDKMRQRDTFLAYAISLVGICSLNWSSARKMIAQKVGRLRRDVKEVINLLPGLERDIQKLKSQFNHVQHRWKPRLQTKPENERWYQDVKVLDDLLQGLTQRSQMANKVGSLKSLFDMNKRCYNAWEALEDHFTLQRRFAINLRRRSARPQDIRALLMASLADPDNAGVNEKATLLRELAALVASTAASRKTETKEASGRSVKRRRST
mmetsp:Transcript_20287/g.39637  ORF Transcript_20287/g.39637 Transcript_20287/m.39637 type:complete len:832 (-) Transcript_20287:58-2553(-)